MTDKVQKAINKYENKFNKFMINIEDQVKNEKAFEGLGGNLFCGLLEQMKNDINVFLKSNKKGDKWYYLVRLLLIIRNGNKT